MTKICTLVDVSASAPKCHIFSGRNGDPNAGGNHQKHMTALLGGCHQFSKTRVRDWRKFGLRGGGLSNSCCQRFAQAEGNSDHPDEGQTKHDAPSSYDPTR
jgi:hypothetical protein